MRETFGTCDGCGRNDCDLAAYVMDDGSVWPLCPSCAYVACRDDMATPVVTVGASA